MTVRRLLAISAALAVIVLAGALVREAAKPGDEPGDSGERAAGSGPGMRMQELSRVELTRQGAVGDREF